MAFIPLYDGTPLRYIGHPYVNWTLIGINVLVFFIFQSGAFIDTDNLASMIFGIIPAAVNELGERLLTVLANLHEQFPLMTNHDRQKVLARLDYVGDDLLLQAVTDRFVKLKKLVGDAKRLARADFKPKLSANLGKLKDKVVAEYQQARFSPPEPSSFAGAAGGNAANLKDLFDVCVADGYLVHVASDVYLHSEAEAEMRRRGLRYVLLGSQSFFDRREVRDLLAYLKVLARPQDETSLLRIINTPARGISTATVEKVLTQAVAQGISFWDAAAAGATSGLIPPRAASAIASFQQLLAGFRRKFLDDPRRMDAHVRSLSA